MNPIRLLIRIYQLLVSPFIGSHCRFTPTCSEYADEACKTHGTLKGSYLTVKRLCRCHPFGGRGYDPVHQNNREQAVKATENQAEPSASARSGKGSI